MFPKLKTPDDGSIIPLDNKDTTNTKAPTYSINLPDDATGKFTVIIDGKNHTSDVVGGKASVTVTNLNAGYYDVTIIYSGDDKYAPIVKSATTKVIVDPNVVIKQSDALYTAKYSVTVYDNEGKLADGASVVFYVNGKNVKTVKTNSKGVATFNLPSNCLPNKKYTITSLGKSASKQVTVKQILSVKKVTVKRSAKKLVLTATLKKVDGKYLKGKKITFKFKGKTYRAKTNKKGVAKVTIKKKVIIKLKKGKKYAYSAKYVKDKVKGKVKVK